MADIIGKFIERHGEDVLEALLSIRLRAATLSGPTASTPIMVTVSTAWTRLPFRNSPASMRG